MENQAVRSIARFSLEVEPEALKRIIESGRLLEFAEAAGREASAQIQAQLVEKVAEAAVHGKGLTAAVGIGAALIFDDGDFGTVPPRPHFGIFNHDLVLPAVLSKVAVTQISR